MNKIFVIIILFFIQIISCESEQQKIHNKCRDTIISHLSYSFQKHNDMFSSLDSLNILMIDTITEKHEYNIPIIYSIDKSDLYIHLTKLQAKITKNQIDLYKLTNNLYNDPYINNIRKDDLLKSKEKIKLYNDSAKYFLFIADSLRGIQNEADSISLRYYGVKCYYRYTKKDMTFVCDTNYYLITKDFRVMDYNKIINTHIK